MSDNLRNNKSKAVLLTAATQIEIITLMDKGKSFEEIDEILEVPKGSSKYTLECVGGV